MDDPRVAAAMCLGLVALAGGAVGGIGVAAVAAGSGGPGPVDQQTAPQPGAAIQESVDPDVVVLRASVRKDGTASWSVAFRTRLDDENATAAFESLQADVAANSSAYTGRFETGMRRTVRSAENRTGREMRLVNLSVEATTEQLGQEYGVVTYRFRWTNFAAVDGDQIRTGDALAGLFLDSETSLVLAWPDGYETDAVRPEPDERRDGAVVWHGRLDFGPDQPRVVLAATGGLDTAVLAVGALLLLALAAIWWVRRARTGEEGADDEAETTAGAESGAQAEDGTAGGQSAADSGPPEELLSNEERVLRLLDEEGGRIKQQRIAEEFDWTDAKTSQVVGALRDEDAVETFRIGRENVVTLPEHSDL
jgi:hypothetical protein